MALCPVGTVTVGHKRRKMQPLRTLQSPNLQWSSGMIYAIDNNTEERTPCKVVFKMKRPRFVRWAPCQTRYDSHGIAGARRRAESESSRGRGRPEAGPSRGRGQGDPAACVSWGEAGSRLERPGGPAGYAGARTPSPSSRRAAAAILLKVHVNRARRSAKKERYPRRIYFAGTTPTDLAVGANALVKIAGAINFSSRS